MIMAKLAQWVRAFVLQAKGRRSESVISHIISYQCKLFRLSIGQHRKAE